MLLPKQMQAISTANKQLVYQSCALPQPAKDEVLIQVYACGVNRADLMQKQGVYPPPAGASAILGLEVAGVVVALGSSVTEWHIGDKVCALVTAGGYAEYCLAPASCCLPFPAFYSFAQAAALPEALFTVWSTVFQRGRLQAGETLLIHGGSSGIGTMAIQLAKALGAKVIVSVGSAEKCHACLALGADTAINYRTEDFVSVVRQVTQERGVDVILDMIGGDYLMRNIQCLAEEGRLVLIALQQGVKTEINLLPFLSKRLTLTGSTLRARDITFKADIAQQLKKHVLPLLDSRIIQPTISQTFAFADAEQAHQLMLSSQHIGKIILRVSHHDL
jgi:putative PIG3 family NAD(P)H quinone oxidoreductase